MTAEQALIKLKDFGGRIIDCLSVPVGTDVVIYSAEISPYNGTIHYYYYIREKPEFSSEGVFFPQLWENWRN